MIAANIIRNLSRHPALVSLVVLTSAAALAAQTALPTPAAQKTTVIHAGMLIDGVSSTPRRDQGIVIRGNRIESVGDAASVRVPEGATVKYVLSATAKNGKAWTAQGSAQVWTTAMAYPAGFQAVFLPVSDDLAPAGK